MNNPRIRRYYIVLQPVGVFLFTYHLGEGTIHLDEFLGKDVDIDFMFFKADSISLGIKDAGFEGKETIQWLRGLRG